MTITPKTNQSGEMPEWEKRFDEKFLHKHDIVPYYIEYEETKDFIRDIIHSEVEKERQKIKSSLEELTKSELEWICQSVDERKYLRSETSKARVKLLMQAAMIKAKNNALEAIDSPKEREE